MIKGIARKYFEGKTCIFCGKYGLYKLKNNKLKCKHCKKYYSLKRLRRNLQILYYFYLEISARKTVMELSIENLCSLENLLQTTAIKKQEN